MASGRSNVIITRATGEVILNYQAQDGASAWIESRDLDLELPAVKKGVRRFFYNLEGSDLTNVELVLKGRNSLRDPLTTIGTWSLDVGSEDPLKIWMEKFRYLRIRIQDDNVKSYWALYSMELWGDLGSRAI